MICGPLAWAIGVRDQSDGIVEAGLKKVVEPFNRLESSRNRETGDTRLGLAIAHQPASSLSVILRQRTLSNSELGAEQTLSPTEEIQ